MFCLHLRTVYTCDGTETFLGDRGMSDDKVGSEDCGHPSLMSEPVYGYSRYKRRDTLLQLESEHRSCPFLIFLFLGFCDGKTQDLRSYWRCVEKRRVAGWDLWCSFSFGCLCYPWNLSELTTSGPPRVPAHDIPRIHSSFKFSSFSSVNFIERMCASLCVCTSNSKCIYSIFRFSSSRTRSDVLEGFDVIEETQRLYQGKTGLSKTFP